MKTIKVVSTGAGRNWLAVAAGVGIYCLMTVGTVGIVTISGVTSAEARGGHGGGHGGYHGGHGGYHGGHGGYHGGHAVYHGGHGRYYGGYGGSYGYGYYGDDCYWSRRYGRWVCPYSY
jgi:hypothetical protein